MDYRSGIVTPIYISSTSPHSLDDSDSSSEKLLLLDHVIQKEKRSCLFYAPKAVFISTSIVVLLVSTAVFTLVILYTLNAL